MEEDIRKKGMLYQYQHRFGKKWRKVWCVLLADSTHSVARLELYEFRQMSVSEGRSVKRTENKKVILLRDCVQISESESGECPKNCSAFQLETVNKLYTFAAQEPDVREWVRELCRLAFPLNQAESRLSGQTSVLHPSARDRSSVEMKENSLYETAASMRDFLVIAMGTEAAQRCNLYGDYILTPLDDRILLKDHKTRRVVLSWPYCFIRKFGQDRLSFSFEAGRRCETGEGSFEFTTTNGERIFKIVSDAIENLPLSERAGSKTRTEEKVKLFPPDEEDTGVYSTISPLPCDGTSQESLPPSLPKQQPSKKLTTTFRSLSLNSIEPPSKGQVRNINSCPSTTSSTAPAPEESLYASVSKPRVNGMKNNPKNHWQAVKDNLQLLGPLPDPLENLPLPEIEEPRETSQNDDLSPPPDDYIAEAIYAEPAELQATAFWEVAGGGHTQDTGGDKEAKNGGEDEEPQPEGFSTYDNLMTAGKRL
ncbi:docking protein 3 [Hoplias malabaricus]|uniref:docking protein 3 n=1 Tax=Hoplias malabaricus TaxID=27720 RepID=UPI0034627EF4